jgi:hypothetical protein
VVAGDNRILFDCVDGLSTETVDSNVESALEKLDYEKTLGVLLSKSPVADPSGTYICVSRVNVVILQALLHVPS